jgi:DNA-binding transcriptional regulator LsrR (DeoR family)
MVARLHYESDLSQIEIARRLGLSAATVSRLLKRARDEGIVRIEIQDLVPHEDLGRELSKRLKLETVSLSEGAASSPLTGLAAPLGEILKSRLKQGSVLAVGWGRAIREVIRTGLPRIPGVITVPATGGMQQPAPHFQISEFVRLAAEQLGGTPCFIHAPYLISSEARDAFLNDPMIREQIALWDRIDVAIVGVGIPHAIDPIHASAATADERAMTNVAGDVIRHYFDINGELLSWNGNDRLIAVSVEQLRAIPLVVGLAVSPQKARAIIGATRAALINALVTDVPTAQAILDAL